MSTTEAAIRNFEQQVLGATKSEQPLDELAKVIKSAFPKFYCHKSDDMLHVTPPGGLILSVGISGEGKFRTSENKNLSGFSLLNFTSGPVWSEAQLVEKLIQMNSKG